LLNKVINTSNTKTTQISLFDKKKPGNITSRSSVNQTERKPSATKLKGIIGYGAKKPLAKKIKIFKTVNIDLDQMIKAPVESEKFNTMMTE
jgi:hypothetical protein